MISAGEFSIEKCGDNIECQNAVKQLKDGCKRAHEEDGEEKVAQCIDEYVKSDSMPPFKEDDPVVQLGLITKDTYSKMALMKTLGQWPGDEASAPEEASEEVATAEEPAATEEEKKEEEEPSNIVKPGYLRFSAGAGYGAGGLEPANLLPGQEGMSIGGMSLALRLIGTIPVADGFGISPYFGFKTFDIADQTLEGTTMTQSMGVSEVLDFGLGGTILVGSRGQGMFMPSIGLSLFQVDGALMGAEGTKNEHGETDADANSISFGEVGALNIGATAGYCFADGIVCAEADLSGGPVFPFSSSTDSFGNDSSVNGWFFRAGANLVLGLPHSISSAGSDNGAVHMNHKVEADAEVEAEAAAEDEVDMPPAEEADTTENPWKAGEEVKPEEADETDKAEAEEPKEETSE